jgi:hypothetical protein
MNFQKLVVLLITGLLWSDSAMAYVDPVNGAMMLQLLLSGIAGGLMVFRRALSDLLRRIIGRRENKSDTHE